MSMFSIHVLNAYLFMAMFEILQLIIHSMDAFNATLLLASYLRYYFGTIPRAWL